MTALIAPRHPPGSPRLYFSPWAWLKLMFFAHAGPTEIAGFGISREDDLLYVEDLVILRQYATAWTVAFADDALADYVDRQVDAGLPLERVMRIWCHTHPGTSARPSQTDEDTFRRVFGGCDWALMFIVSRTGQTYARLSFHVGPGASLEIPVSVDWQRWPEGAALLASPLAAWKNDYDANVQRIPEIMPDCPQEDPFMDPALFWHPPSPLAAAFEDPDPHWEEYEHHARLLYDDV